MTNRGTTPGMILVELHGGLGNQIFQYSFGEHMRSVGNSVSYIARANTFDPGPTTRVCQVSRFLDIRKKKLFRGRAASLLLGAAHRAGSGPLSMIAKIVDLTNEGNLSDAEHKLKEWHSAVSIAVGYFQFFQMMSAIPWHDEGLERLLCSIAADVNKRLENRIKFEADVLVHVRRGDYIASRLPLCNEQYYERALAICRQAGWKGECFVFSDQPEMVPSCLREAHILLIDDPLEVLALLSRAHVLIIANSTLSFWGARLNKRVGTCIAPRQWPINSRQFCEAGRLMSWVLEDNG